MVPYKNNHGSSGVAGYDLFEDAIVVYFRNGVWYRYDNTTPGASHVVAMKQLAALGRGLSTYISQRIRQAFASSGRST